MVRTHPALTDGAADSCGRHRPIHSREHPSPSHWRSVVGPAVQRGSAGHAEPDAESYCPTGQPADCHHIDNIDVSIHDDYGRRRNDESNEPALERSNAPRPGTRASTPPINIGIRRCRERPSRRNVPDTNETTRTMIRMVRPIGSAADGSEAICPTKFSIRSGYGRDKAEGVSRFSPYSRQ